MRARTFPPSSRPQPTRSQARSPVSALFLALVLPRGGASVCAWAEMRPSHFRCIHPYCSRARHCQIIAGLSAGRKIAARLTLLKLCAPNLAAAQQSGLAAILGPAACAQMKSGSRVMPSPLSSVLKRCDPNIDIPPTHHFPQMQVRTWQNNQLG